jgi:transcription elongation factor SPT6
LYGFIIDQSKPGHFLLIYKHPKNSTRKETIVVRPTGYDFRGKKFPSVDAMIQYFKVSEQQAAKAAQRNREPSQQRPNRDYPTNRNRNVAQPQSRQQYSHRGF